MLDNDEIRAALLATAEPLTVPDDLLRSVFHRAAVVRRRRRTAAGGVAAFALVGGAAVPVLRDRIDSLTVVPPAGRPSATPPGGATPAVPTASPVDRPSARSSRTPAATERTPPAAATPASSVAATRSPFGGPPSLPGRRPPLGWAPRGLRANDAALVGRARVALGDRAAAQGIIVLWGGDLPDGTTSLLFELAIGDGTVERWHYSETNGAAGTASPLYAGGNADDRDGNAVVTDPAEPRLLLLRAPGTLYAKWLENTSAGGDESGPYVEHDGTDIDGLTIFPAAPDGDYWTDVIRVHHRLDLFFEEYLARQSGP